MKGVRKSRRRALGEGSIYQRTDGKWEATLSLGVKAGGKRYKRKVIAHTMAAAAARLEQLKLEVAWDSISRPSSGPLSTVMNRGS